MKKTLFLMVGLFFMSAWNLSFASDSYYRQCMQDGFCQVGAPCSNVGVTSKTDPKGPVAVLSEFVNRGMKLVTVMPDGSSTSYCIYTVSK